MTLGPWDHRWVRLIATGTWRGQHRRHQVPVSLLSLCVYSLPRELVYGALPNNVCPMFLHQSSYQVSWYGVPFSGLLSSMRDCSVDITYNRCLFTYHRCFLIVLLSWAQVPWYTKFLKDELSRSFQGGTHADRQGHHIILLLSLSLLSLSYEWKVHLCKKCKVNNAQQLCLFTSFRTCLWSCYLVFAVSYCYTFSILKPNFTMFPP
jgi:hypothetical protein